MVKKKVIKKKVKDPWFKKGDNSSRSWGFVPVNFKGWAALLLLIVVNVFSAQYFNLNVVLSDSYLKFGVVFFLSLAVFILIAMRKTKN